MADVAPDADDEDRTVNESSFVDDSEPFVDQEAPAEPVPAHQTAEVPSAVHDPDVKIPEDVETVEDPVTELVHHQHATANVSPIAKTGEKDVKGTFRGHAALQAERQANEAALVAQRVDPVA